MEDAQNYAQAIDRTPLLTPDEEVYLAGVIQRGRKPGASKMARRNAERAEHRWVEGNLRLVLSIVNKMRDPHGAMDRDDLIQEGNMGLIHALRKFDFDRGIKFSTYAAFWVNHYVQRAMENNARTIRLPSSVENTLRGINRARASLVTLLDREPTDEEVADEAGMTVEKLRRLKAQAQPPTSLTTEDGAIDVAAPDEPASVEDLITGLDETKQEIIRLRYGADLTRAEVARRLEKDVKTVYRHEQAALATLRRAA